MSGQPKVLSSVDLPTDQAKWISLKKITYRDAEGKERPWECAERRTRKSTGVDAVAMLAMIKSKTNAFPLSTVIIEQYRPPIDAFVVELPAGLIDEGESAEDAALRELVEETGFKAERIIESSPVIVSDPGMTNANMKLVLLSVTLPGEMETPEAQLEAGEFITKRVVALADLNEELKAYDKRGFVVDARLSHFAQGYDLARRVKEGEFA
ncbi:hypothetical protein CYLTODRAFT_422278 [Cylindrobasidium torrendii FP15055 ss-10]|uniref:Nudix hydrolase domain-containing protein n=1 Tax=Cylindrobasidium torrendii FP15055 ss-10 TaxID=1314674 RepID=A0A0D7BB00_9AGAR|nr:hypothetical protein CYLTODRAFT_422278 [Cylindrobasidium torrendii FP15055 ss-10]